jgi:hypothetical protein
LRVNIADQNKNMKTPKVFTETEKSIIRNKIINRANLERQLLQEKSKDSEIKTGESETLDMDFILDMLEENS